MEPEATLGDRPAVVEFVTRTIDVRQLHPLFVGELAGTDLRALDERGIDEIRSLMDRFAVLVVRNQPFEDAEQVAFAKRLGGGEIVTKVGRSVIDHAARLTEPGMTDISNLDENQAIIARDDRRRMYSLGNRLWHTDSSFQDPIARYSMLSAKEVPSSGGETEYADMRAAYDAFPDALKTEIEELRAFHSIIYSRSTIGFTDFSDAERAQFPGAEHALVRVHPGSGRKSVYLASHASHVVGCADRDDLVDADVDGVHDTLAAHGAQPHESRLERRGEARADRAVAVLVGRQPVAVAQEDVITLHSAIVSRPQGDGGDRVDDHRLDGERGVRVAGDQPGL